MAAMNGRRPSALRVSHSGVVEAWRERERKLTEAGIDVTLVTAKAWNEGGQSVHCRPRLDEAVISVRTWGTHPALFLYDPRPLWRLLRGSSFDVVDIHEEPYSLAAAEVNLLRRWLAPRSVLVLYSAQNLYKRYPWPIRMLERSALRAASAIYPCSAAAADVLRRKGFRNALQILPLGVDLDRFTPAGPGTARPAEDRFRVGYVGRLLPHKGVDVLIKAVGPEPNWELDIVGAGSDEPALRQLVTSLGIDGRVTLRGFIDHDDLVTIYRRNDVLAVPSLLSSRLAEQFCRVAVEAMACGVPVVASDVGSLAEVVGDGGLLVPPGDEAALREALRRIAHDERLRRDLGLKALARSRRFSWFEVARAHADLYRRVVA